MTDINKASADYVQQVAVTQRVNADMYIGGRAFTTVSALAGAAFIDGWNASAASRGLSFDVLAEANRSRVARWHGIDDWSPLEWAGAMCGEAGEAANYAKKLKRHTTGILNPDKRLGGDADITNRVREYSMKAAYEVADAVVYGSLLCQRVDQDLGVAVRHVFNEKSIECGFPERI